MEHGAGATAGTPSPMRSEHAPRCEGRRMGVDRGFVRSGETKMGRRREGEKPGGQGEPVGERRVPG